MSISGGSCRLLGSCPCDFRAPLPVRTRRFLGSEELELLEHWSCRGLDFKIVYRGAWVAAVAWTGGFSFSARELLLLVEVSFCRCSCSASELADFAGNNSLLLRERMTFRTSPVSRSPSKYFLKEFFSWAVFLRG